MNEDDVAQGIVTIIGGALALMIGFGAISVAPGLIANHQRYTTYLEAQRTVLQCRADNSIAAIDRVCGPIPTLESIK